MSLIRGCDSCHKAIIGLSWWSFKLRDKKTHGSVMSYDLCDRCKRRVMEAIGILKAKPTPEAADLIAKNGANVEEVRP